MSYFNHAFKKVFPVKDFVLTAEDITNPDGTIVATNVTHGVITTSDLHVASLKDPLLGPGTLGFFNPETYLSLDTDDLNECCPFLVAGAAIKLNDKQGPYHGGYREANKSKMVNPKYLNKMWVSPARPLTQAVVEIGETQFNIDLGGVLTLDTLVGGTGYSDAIGVAVTGGSGSGLTLDIIVAAGVITSAVINENGIGYVVGDTVTIVGGNDDATIDVATVITMDESDCNTKFYCGETYYLRIDVKGTPALRFASHNLYRTLDASGGCCADPAVPVEIEAIEIYTQWGQQIKEDQFFMDFIMPVLIADGDSYAFTAEDAAVLGITNLIADAPASPTTTGLVLMGSYIDTTFGNCSFVTTDYYGVDPIQIYASEVDLNGDPCTFSGVCVSERCPGMKASGLGEEKVRDLIIAESYLQNFIADDQRIREITQGTEAYSVLERGLLYHTFYIQHVVPRYNNPSSTFDHDQYILEIIGTEDSIGVVYDIFEEMIGAGCLDCKSIDVLMGDACTYTLPEGQ